MLQPTIRDLRIFSELAYTDLLTAYFSEQGSKLLNEYKDLQAKLLEHNSKSELLSQHIKKLFENWELVNTLQALIKADNSIENPLLDGFIFKNALNNIYVISFRGTNLKNDDQKKKI